MERRKTDLATLSEKIGDLIDALKKTKADLINALEKTKGTLVTVRNIPVLNDRYWIFEIDLTKVHTDLKLGVEEFLRSRHVECCTFISIIEVPAPWSYKVNSSNAPAVDAVVGDEWENFEIKEIYVSNAVGLGIGKLHIEWRSP